MVGYFCLYCRKECDIRRCRELPSANSYIAGTILLGIAPCTAMVLMWGYLSCSNQGYFSHGSGDCGDIALCTFRKMVVSANNLIVPWETIVLSVLIYVGLPLLAGVLSRYWIFHNKGRKWFEEKFLHYLSPIAKWQLYY